MAIRLPSDKDLQEMAQANHFELNDEELASFQEMIPGMLQSYERVYQMPDPREPNKYPERDPGRRPSREDDPFNAIIRYCSLRGAASGKLAGKRIGLKNNICVAGMPTTNASLVMEDFVADTDATVVTRLLDEGAEIAALLNLENFSFAVGNTSTFGPVLNPHNPEHIAGGSSGGSGAALYYDEVDITIGGDQGGSIRIPASWCWCCRPEAHPRPGSVHRNLRDRPHHRPHWSHGPDGCRRRPDAGGYRWQRPDGPPPGRCSGPAIHRVSGPWRGGNSNRSGFPGVRPGGIPNRTWMRRCGRRWDISVSLAPTLWTHRYQNTWTPWRSAGRSSSRELQR